jgi:3-hydroxyacyl-CoA dehydrogenase
MKIRKVGVVGGGAMGGGIAQTVTGAGLPVVLKDINDELVEKALGIIRSIYQRRVDKGKITQEELEKKMALVAGTTTYDDFEDVDLVIEAVPENMGLKKKVFKELDEVCKEDAILATNTSSLSISEIASATGRPQKVVGMHWFNPPHVMKLIEAIPGIATSDETVSTLIDFSRTLKKIPIRVRECPGFLVNRLLMPYVSEAVLCLQEGAASARQIDDAMKEFGWPMGPFTLSDMLGLDVIADIGGIMVDGYGPRTVAPQLTQRLVKMGRLGKKTGAGFYGYGDQANEPTMKAIKEIQGAGGRTGTEFSPERLMYPMVNEAVMCIQEGIATPADIDTAMMVGTGFPRGKGGPLHWADSVGVDVILRGLEKFTDELGPRLYPAPLLKRMVAAGHIGLKAGKGFFEYPKIRPEGHKYVTYEVADRVALVTINNPPRNVLSAPVVLEIEKVFDQIAADDSIKGVIIKGAGRVFATGADIEEIVRIKSAAQGEELTGRMHKVFGKIENLRKLVIACIHGYCLGGGLELALACHMRVAGDKTTFGLPEITLGIMPGAGGTQRLPRVVGKGKALEMILTGASISAQDAKAIGLVNRIVPIKELVPETKKLAGEIIARGQVAVRTALKSVSEGLEKNLQGGLKLESKLFGGLCETEDMREGLSAFLEKRPPKFKDK